MIRGPAAALAIILFSIPALAYDLSDYPEPFAEEGEVDAVVVVGDDAPASHVIAQTNIALSLNQQAGSQQFGIAKLASEVSSIEQNIISIGNPCTNSISAALLDLAKCDEGFEPGFARIIAKEYGKYVHIVAAGYTDKGTAAAANMLKDFSKQDFDGEEIIITVDEPLEIDPIQKEIEEVPTHDITQETEKENPQEREVGQEQPQSPAEEYQQGQQEASEAQQEQKGAQTEGTGIFKRFAAWLRSLFG